MPKIQCVEVVAEDGLKMWANPADLESLKAGGWKEIKGSAKPTAEPAAKKPAAKKKK